MEDSERKKPAKGILKSSSSFDKQEKPQRRNKNTKWDEMNIMATFHPADKDYGHMKVEEPKTPYNWNEAEEDDVDAPQALNPEELAKKLSEEASSSRRRSTPSLSESDEDDDSNLTEDERAKRREFKNRRKMHYNEFLAVKLARKLMEEEEEEDGDTSSKGDQGDQGDVV